MTWVGSEGLAKGFVPRAGKVLGSHMLSVKLSDRHVVLWLVGWQCAIAVGSTQLTRASEWRWASAMPTLDSSNEVHAMWKHHHEGLLCTSIWSC